MPLAQTWHAMAEFYRLHNRFITVCIKSSGQVAPGQAKTKARSGSFQKGAIRQAHGPEQSRRTDVQSIRRQGHGGLHHFETAHYCECIGHYKKRHTHAPYTVWRL